MKLFLASQDFGNFANKLLELLGNNKRTLLIINARDERDNDYRREKIAEKKAKSEKNGLEWLGELDLRKFFGKEQELKNYLIKQNVGHIHVTGGNTFLLRKAFALSGFDKIIIDLLKENKLVYSGSSAGSMVMTPDFKYYTHDDIEDIKVAGYPDAIIWEGLNLVNTYICPHYSTIGHERTSRQRVAEFERDKVPFVLLNDSEVLVVDGEKIEVLTKR